jgi:hypothetical protein
MKEGVAMRKVKIFKSLENDVTRLEAEVNEWIAQSGATIISLSGNIAPQSERTGAGTGAMGDSRYPPSDIVLIVLYEVR